MKLAFVFAGNRHVLNGRYRLRIEIGWGLLATMIACCLALALLPDSWRPLQNFAALVQAFISGLVAAQWLPLWDAEPAAAERVAPSMDRH